MQDVVSFQIMLLAGVGVGSFRWRISRTPRMAISWRPSAALKLRLKSLVPPGWNMVRIAVVRRELGVCECGAVRSCPRRWKRAECQIKVQTWTCVLSLFDCHDCLCSFIYRQSPQFVLWISRSSFPTRKSSGKILLFLSCWCETLDWKIN